MQCNVCPVYNSWEMIIQFETQNEIAINELMIINGPTDDISFTKGEILR